MEGRRTEHYLASRSRLTKVTHMPTERWFTMRRRSEYRSQDAGLAGLPTVATSASLGGPSRQQVEMYGEAAVNSCTSLVTLTFPEYDRQGH